MICFEGVSDHQATVSTSAIEQPSTSVEVLGSGAEPVTSQLRSLERECASLRVSLEAVRKQCTEYQQLASEMEAHIAKLTQEREQLERSHTSEIEDASQRTPRWPHF